MRLMFHPAQLKRMGTFCLQGTFLYEKRAAQETLDEFSVGFGRNLLSCDFSRD